jgi:hypothetical protein
VDHVDSVDQRDSEDRRDGVDRQELLQVDVTQSLLRLPKGCSIVAECECFPKVLVCSIVLAQALVAHAKVLAEAERLSVKDMLGEQAWHISHSILDQAEQIDVQSLGSTLEPDCPILHGSLSKRDLEADAIPRMSIAYLTGFLPS